MAQWALRHWMEWLFGVAGLGLTAACAALARYVRAKFCRLDALEMALRASLYDRLYYLHGKYMVQGWVSVPDLENISGIYQGYHALGGNSVGTKLYRDLSRLPNFAPGRTAAAQSPARETRESEPA